MSFAQKNGLLGGSKTRMLAAGNKLSGSSLNQRDQQPHKIGFPDGWRTGPTEEWYRSQATTRFTHLQYRKEREAPFLHEFVVAELDNGTICRFDRRGDVDTRANAFTLEGMQAEDTAHVINRSQPQWAETHNNSDIVLRVEFPNGQDLLAILAVCYGIQKDSQTRAYTLTKYNCYFLSWTVITATARMTVDWAMICKDAAKWEDLVSTTIDGLNSRSSNSDRAKGKARSIFRRKDRTPPLNPEPPHFVGLPQLITALRKALFETRAEMQRGLAQIILQSKVDTVVRQISQAAVKQAAHESARNHAGLVARDAAMEAVIETMWRTILASENGGQRWEDQSKLVEGSIWKAAIAAADSDAQVQGDDTGTTSWERAWDISWEESQDGTASGEGRQTVKATAISEQATISLSAKEAWRNSWLEACKASNEYVPLVTEGVSDYVKKNLPDSLSNALSFDIPDPSIRNVLNIGSDKTNSQLQLCVQSRIRDHCLRLRNMGFPQDPLDIEESMQRIWVQALGVLEVQGD